MKKTLFLTAMLALALTACSKGGNKPTASAPQGSDAKTMQIDPKAAAPAATDVRTPPVDPKTGKPAASEPAK